MNTTHSRLGGRRGPFQFHELALLVAIVLVFLITGILDPNHTYFTRFGYSATIILRNTALLGIVSLGAAVVIIAGGIDLSVGSMVAFSATTCALILVMFAQPTDTRLVTVSALGVVCAIAGAVLAGFLVGTLHTWLITAIRLPPFVATLATLVGLRSFARAMCEFVTTERWGSQNQLINVNTPFFQYVKEHGVLLSMTTFIVLAIITWLILSRTVLGRHLYALGGNEQAARLSGIRTENVKWFAYCYGAMTAAIAGIFMMADVSMAQPVNLAMGMELNAIAAAVVGGCSLQGGVGTVMGTVLGALFLRLVIDVVAKLIKSGADVYEGMIVGGVVVLAVTFTQLRQFRGAGGGLFSGVRGLFAIPTLGISIGMLAMMVSGHVRLFKGRSVLAGVAAGVIAIVILAGVRWAEQRRQARAG